MMTSKPEPVMVSELQMRLIGLFVIAAVCVVGAFLG